MRRFCALVFVLLGVAIATPALAASQPAPSQQTQQSSCGKTAAEALTTARAALAQNDAAHERTALACLIAAVSALNADKLDVVRDPDEARMLAVPRNSAKAP